MKDTFLMVVRASTPRRYFAIATLLVLGGFLIFIALAQPSSSLGVQVFLLASGGVGLWLAERLRRATLLHLELTLDELRWSNGEVLARVDEIVSVDRGVFAYKPSNGFVLRLSGRGPLRWEPGMWWRTGRRLGVGGVASAPQAKAMAEMISAMIAEREK
ncbi:hypothetical protein OO012_09365 [Rhodobacteraceae bacterium KMM 6894]|nr:hypothetical protein [Rhodobacteraceae bacterium KMM 6894]